MQDIELILPFYCRLDVYKRQTEDFSQVLIHRLPCHSFITASMSSVGRSAAMNTVQEAVGPSKEIRGTTAAALVDAA